MAIGKSDGASNSLPADWHLVHTISIDPRAAQRIAPRGIPLAPAAEQYLRRNFPAGIYEHQYYAVEQLVAGKHVCLATSTASGKTLAFTTAAIDHLAKTTEARVLAIYPQRSLGNEQERRWQIALHSAGVKAQVGRIDGSVASSTRSEVLRRSRILVATPDVLHAWLLAHLGDAAVREFISGLAMVIVDEVHTYTGVFGSNAAYLFRRLQHAARSLGARPQFFAASATIRDPQRHLELLFGLKVSLIGPEADSSPRQRVDIHLIVPPRKADYLTEVTSYLRHLVDRTDLRFIAFVDSRKQAEYIPSILNRSDEGADNEDADSGVNGNRLGREPEENITHDDEPRGDMLDHACVVPYRSGYEEYDRQRIEKRLAEGSLRGVVSTSALELGIDLPHLDIAVLVGVPRSSTSLQQRIGRIGRAGPGAVVVINSGEIYDEAVFRSPEKLLDRPPAEGALYLENRFIQYIHALCLARQGGEHDQVAAGGASADDMLRSDSCWPPNFLELCHQERTGQIPPDLQAMKAESGDNPNLMFPLRDVESQFKVELRSGPIRQPLGHISFGQLMREAYPGGVYLYAMRRYRVASISLRERTVTVRQERKWYSTRPIKLPTMVFPNLGSGNIFRGVDHGPLRMLEANEQIREALSGFKERRGNAEEAVQYPLSGDVAGVYFNSSRFTRNYFTTGALLHHHVFDLDLVPTEVFAGLLYEALLMTAPYERQDVGIAVDKVRVKGGPIPWGSRFVTIFDQTYGSLRLSGRLLDGETLAQVAKCALELAQNDDRAEVDERVLVAARAVLIAAEAPPTTLIWRGSAEEIDPTNMVSVIMPGSFGINVTNGNTDFLVEKVFFSPRYGSLAYGGHHDTSANVEGQTEIIPCSALEIIAGVSQTGYYNLETGEITAEKG